MRAIGLALLLVLAAGATVAAQSPPSSRDIGRETAPASQLDSGRRWAVLVGVNKYLDPQIPSLRYCVADARLLARVLSQYAGYEPERILLITDDQEEDHLQPLGINLRIQIRGWLKKAEPGDTVLVAFSGHGFLDDRGQSFLAPKDCERENLGLTGFRTDDLRDMLHQCKATQKVLLLDCCHAGSERSGETVGPSSSELGLAFRNAAGLITLASCDRAEKSEEWDAQGQGLFTYFLAEGLKGAADYDGNGLIDSYELHRYTLDQVSLTAQTKLNGQQTPKLLVGEDVKGVFTLARVERRPTRPRLTRNEVKVTFHVWEGSQKGTPFAGAKLELMYRQRADAGWSVLGEAVSGPDGSAEMIVWPEGTTVGKGEYQVLATSPQSRKAWPMREFPDALAWNVFVPAPIRALGEWTNSLGMRLALLPAGTFLMGSPASAGNPNTDDAPHTVRISRPFYIGVHEVTVGQFRQYARATGYQNSWGMGYDPQSQSFAGGSEARPFNYERTGWPQNDQHPAVNISWNDANAFCAWLSQKEGRRYYLPTEAQWEYACRAGTTTTYYFGDEETSLQGNANVADAAFRANNAVVRQPGYYDYTAKWNDGFAFTAPVGSFRPNRFGLYDMHGNVQEWCSDWYDPNYYLSSPQVDPRGPASGQARVKRGGDWLDYLTIVTSSFRRSEVPPGNYAHFIGFRVAMDP